MRGTVETTPVLLAGQSISYRWAPRLGDIDGPDRMIHMDIKLSDVPNARYMRARLHHTMMSVVNHLY
eukprot:SAG31_NODE_4266_length_3393_cov_4.735883_1_plen_67_part_00